MATEIAPGFLADVLRIGKEVLVHREKRIAVDGFPEFIVFFSREKPKTYYFDMSEHFTGVDGGIYVAYEPPLGENRMLKFSTYKDG